MKVATKYARMAASLAAIPILMTTFSFAQYQDPPTRVARIAYLEGAVSFQPAGFDTWNDAPPNYPMVSGDRIYTEAGARGIIQNGSIDVRLWGQTDVTLTNLTDQYEQVALATGFIRVRVFALNPGNTVEVDTPNAAVFIQQPGDYRFNAYSPQASLIAVNAGSVQITGPGINQQVDPGQAVQVYGTNPIDLGLVGMPGYDDLDRWSMDRDRYIMASVSGRYVSREIPGYYDLDAYGGWVVTPDYGPVWYPNAMPVGWQPYTIGHWAYVNPWGWTWVDDAPWGYAPFHYGRWAVVGGRWGWAPGPPNVVPVYSPALVAFVGSPGGGGGAAFVAGVAAGIAAWFPLGIAEPYVPWYHCTPNYVRTVNVTNINTTVIHNTTIINNYNTFITNTRNVTNVNQINVTNVNYVNRTHVYAVPAQTFSSGARVQQAAVHLNDQQMQQLAKAPIVVAKAPAPAPSKPLLQPRPNVSQPVARPVVMTPRGPAVAKPAANLVAVKPVSLPKPQPATAIKPATKPIAPNLKPAAPVGTQPGQPAKPTTPVNNAKPATPPANNARPATAPTNPQPKPATTNETKPAQPANNAPPAKPPTKTQTAPENRPPAHTTEPSKPPQNKPSQQENKPPQQTRPEAQPQHPANQPQAHPQAKTPPKEQQKPEEKKKPEEEKPDQEKPQ